MRRREYGLGSQESGRRGDWMETATGSRFWPLDPREGEVDPLDISQALSKVCRYGGHCVIFYSVAEHSVLVSKILEEWGEAPSVQFAGLMHDATEAYLGDMVRPLKVHMPEYKAAERRLARVIERRFGLSHGDLEAPVVKEADNSAIRTEVDLVMVNSTGWHFPAGVRTSRATISGLPPAEAAKEFWLRFMILDLQWNTLEKVKHEDEEPAA